MDRTATLAFVAADQDAFTSAGKVHKIIDHGRPVAKAVLLQLWMEAQRQWRLSLTTTSTPTPASTSTSSTDEKPPKTWAKCVETYELKLLDGARRQSPAHMPGGGRNPRPPIL